MLFFACQVIYQNHTVVSDKAGASVTYAEPALSVIKFMGIFSLDVLSLTPPACIWPGATFYTSLLLKTAGPFAAVVALWCLMGVRYVNCYWLMRKAANDKERLEFQKSARSSIRYAIEYSFLFLNLVIPYFTWELVLV